MQQISTEGTDSNTDRVGEPCCSPLNTAETGSGWRFAYVLSQVAVRVVVVLVLFTVWGASSVASGHGTVVDRGSAVASSCDRVGPVSTSGVGWWWKCEAAVTWSDGDTSTESFSFSGLTPENETVPVDVERREWDKRGSAVLLSGPAPYSSFGAALMIPLLGVALVGTRVPGVPPLAQQERAERRRRLRYLAWQPLLLPVGWAMVLGGGVTAGSLGGAAVLPIVVGHALLAVGVGVAVTRRRHGIGSPSWWPQTRISAGMSWGKTLVGIGVLGLLVSLLAISSGWQAVLSAALVPAAVVAFGIRLLLVARRYWASSEPHDT